MNTRKKVCYNIMQKADGKQAITYVYQGEHYIIVDDIKPGKLEKKIQDLEKTFSKSKTFDDFDKYLEAKVLKIIDNRRIVSEAAEIAKKWDKYLKDHNLRIEKVSRGINVKVVSEVDEDIYFYSKVEELDEYFRLATRTDDEKRAAFVKVLDYFNASGSRYSKEKPWTDGTLMRFSKHNIPPISVDFKYTPQFLYGKKADKPAIVKIKLTGNDDQDFKMAFKNSGLTKEQIRAIEDSKSWTWHHLDDYDPVTGECTMQLVDMLVHKKSCTHIGGAGMYKAYNGIGYPNREIKKVQ